MIRLLEKDRLQVGTPQLVLENPLLSVLILPEIGGRILQITNHALAIPDGSRFLHRLYPQSVQFGLYTEYGGMEECIGSAPGRLWNIPWRVEKQRDGVTLSAISSTPSSKVMIQKSITLHDTEPILTLEYRFTNLDARFTKFTFGIHPEIALCKTPENFQQNHYCIPSNEGLVEGDFAEPGYKDFVIPSEGWCALFHREKALGMFFPDNIIDAVEIYYPRIGTHLVMQPMIYGVGISPNRRARFDYWLYCGEGDIQKMRELRERFADALNANYEVVPSPPKVKAPERTHIFMQPRPRVTVPAEEFGPLNHEPAAEAPPLVLPVPLAPPPEIQPRRQPAFNVIKRDFQFPSETCDTLKIAQQAGVTHVTASQDDQIHITIRCLKPAGQDTEQWKPEVTMTHGTLIVYVTQGKQRHATEGIQQIRCDIRLPVRFRELQIESTRAKIEIENIQPHHLEIDSKEGDVAIRTVIPPDASFRVCSVLGNVSVWLPAKTECLLEAISVTGIVQCAYDLQNAHVDPHSVRGTLHKPSAELHLSSVDGTLRILTAELG